MTKITRKRKPGPLAKPKDQKLIAVYVGLTEAERAFLEKLAKAQGLKPGRIVANLLAFEAHRRAQSRTSDRVESGVAKLAEVGE